MSWNQGCLWTTPVGCSHENVTKGLSRRVSLMAFFHIVAHPSAMWTIRALSGFKPFALAFLP